MKNKEKFKVGDLVYIYDTSKTKTIDSFVLAKIVECLYDGDETECDLYNVVDDNKQEHIIYYPKSFDKDYAICTRMEYFKFLQQELKKYEKQKKAILKAEKNIQKIESDMCDKFGHIGPWETYTTTEKETYYDTWPGEFNPWRTRDVTVTHKYRKCLCCGKEEGNKRGY